MTQPIKLTPEKPGDQPSLRPGDVVTTKLNGYTAVVTAWFSMDKLDTLIQRGPFWD